MMYYLHSAHIIASIHSVTTAARCFVRLYSRNNKNTWPGSCVYAMYGAHTIFSINSGLIMLMLGQRHMIDCRQNPIVGSPSTTLAQHWSNSVWMSRVCWVNAKLNQQMLSFVSGYSHVTFSYKNMKCGSMLGDRH